MSAMSREKMLLPNLSRMVLHGQIAATLLLLLAGCAPIRHYEAAQQSRVK